MKRDELHYLKNNVEAMSQDELVLFLYRELIVILNMALHHLQIGDVENRVLTIHRANEFIMTLLNALNYDAGEITFQFRAIYYYAIKLLTKANFDKDPENVLQVSKIFRSLHDAWKEKMEKDRQANPMPQKQDNKNEPAAGEQKKNLECYG